MKREQLEACTAESGMVDKHVMALADLGETRHEDECCSTVRLEVLVETYAFQNLDDEIVIDHILIHTTKRVERLAAVCFAETAHARTLTFCIIVIVKKCGVILLLRCWLGEELEFTLVAWRILLTCIAVAVTVATLGAECIWRVVSMM